MRAVIQRVNKANITINDTIKRSIGSGLVVFLGVMENDTDAQAFFMAQKVCELRVFKDSDEKMNLSLKDVGGDILIVSNFTLSADCKRGRRPSFDASAPANEAERLYNIFIEKVKDQSCGDVQTGEFGAHMHVDVFNDGPVNIVIDTEKIGK